MQSCDCLVLGGGPAGSAFAGIVKTHAPEARVLLLEKERFPRWHIGESTIPVANAVLRELGLFEELARSDVVKKIGITFVWGADRRPWNADYLVLRDQQAEGHVLDVVGQDFAELRDRMPQRDDPFFGFNVERSTFDHRLLERAAELGTEVCQGHRVSRIERDAQGRPRVVRWVDDLGRRGAVRPGFVLDATGLAAVMTRGKRERDPDLSNYAVHGYLRRARWKVTYSGTRQRTTVFIAAVPTGWIWYFPIRPDVISVGVVTHRDRFRDRLKDSDPERLFWEMLHSCPELEPLVQDARLAEDILPGGDRVRVSMDWASWAPDPVGPGWAAAGDAAIFVDPILSSGVSLALQSGHRAACTWLTARARPELDVAALWRSYADYIRGEYGAFLRLARYFYGNNRAAESWWWQAHRLVNASGRLDIDPRRAFTMASAGFFPFSRALSLEMMAPLLAGLTGSEAELGRIYQHDGVPDDEELLRHRYRLQAPIRLALRAEPSTRLPGQLVVHHDLVCDDPELLHRRALLPTSIPAQMAPVVEAMRRHDGVCSLLREARQLLAPRSAASVQRATLAIVRLAAVRGYLELQP